MDYWSFCFFVALTFIPSVQAEDKNDNLFYIHGDYFVEKRLYHPTTGEHRYVNSKDSGSLMLQQGWTLEGGSLLIEKKLVNTKTASRYVVY